MTTNLFTPIALGPQTLPNRIVVSPMCQYSADEGCATDWHLVHWGQFALSGAGLLMIEATGVNPEGRITPGCLGLWNDAQEAAIADRLARVREFSDMAFGIQIGHAGRKASAFRPWEGPGHYAPGQGGWVPKAPSALPFAEDWPVPEAMTEDEIAAVVDDFAATAQRAVRLGLKVIEIHAAHGYLLSSFLSPLANRRDDRYGGTDENRRRLPLEVFAAVRAVCPDDVAVGMRFNGTDWVEGGLGADDAVALARALHQMGADFVDVSSGGNAPAKIPVGPGYQLPFASRIRREVGIRTIAVGMIRSPLHAESIITGGEADMVALARGFINDPRWPWHAAEVLGHAIDVAPQYRMGATSLNRPAAAR
ncbi:MAG: Old Yellow Enzyme family NADH:flavin oxidoreductase [Rhodobacteraceae bacterium HLUCCA12]|nr:MAG: Old Yellow Enzyme family NADH:flavin oxidoreductase [Rhodobacteraceae bacterium HLUCCA12]